ncbi:MAG: penicillin-binding protein 2 [Candidatus Hydrogenedentes bacterium]|nr:penicillin-binding protein 2 [Candidatus Hydrogenedentota bacterium]
MMPAPKEPARPQGVERRLWAVALGIIGAFSLLCWQFWQLQVVNRLLFEQKAEENMVRQSDLKADRGIIYGRDGVVLADNRPSADVVLVPGECPQEQRQFVCKRLEELLDISAEDLHAAVQQTAKAEPFAQLPVKQDISKTDRFRLEERAFELPGVLTVVHPQRRYVQGKVGGQILGYLNEVNRQELETWEGYKMGDLVGRGGVESYYEGELKGTDGFVWVTKYAEGFPQLRTDRFGVPYIAKRDSLGHTLERGERRRPVAGNSLYLTLDVGLQGFCESLLGTEVGAIVVLEADTGAVRALASTPTYDPSVFISGRAEEKQALYAAKEPMLNRAYREVYPPGSVFKVMLASAALEEGVINESTTFTCGGSYQLGKRPWHCWSRGHGSVNIVEALAFSCDVFFYNVGMKLGPDRMAEWAKKMGLGVSSGIDLAGEARGLIPTREWKAEFNKKQPVWEQRWQDYDTLNTSIGQGSVSVTPLQNAITMSCILNGGRRVRPYLNAGLGPSLSEPFISPKTLDIVTRGMRMCVEKHKAPSGTGKEAYIEGFAILGKTGTAQFVGLDKHTKYANEEDIPKELRDHAWFIAGVTERTPKIALCILVEHGAHGSSAAAPLARQVIQYFYDHERPSELEPLQEMPLTLAQETR